ncbi:hypothetical protein B0A49_08385 [Cryomyces minteri]|uniref:Aldehyde dehydrogenase domain-containing protein n=1 Tax=Cryomyces minteri TaxID=331657 RepID=A0A4U0X0H5_9PEZI|nr:hypothetical protein B0A49_08385 [Cryomyces minteri]
MSSSPAPASFPRIAISNLEGRAQPTHYRQLQLHRLQTELTKSQIEIKASIRESAGHTLLEADFEYALVLFELREHYESLDPKNELATTRQIELGNDNLDRSNSTSIVYVVPITHTLLYSVLSPVCTAIAAGSCVIVELPQTLRSLTSTLRKLLCCSLDPDTCAISESRPAGDFLQQCTLVLQSWPESHPETREACVSPSSLRAVAVVDRTAHVDEAARDIVSARFSRRGSSPYAPDTVLVNEFVLESFLACLLQHMSPYMAHENGSVGDSFKQKERRPFAESQRIFDTAEKSAGMRVVIRGSNGSIISVQDRDADLLNKKISGPVLIVHPISSLDDGVDFANQSADRTLAASFIFAALPEANYLANYIHAHISCVNHIPAELLVGPIAPLHHAPSLSPRYSRSVFQEPRPQLLNKTVLTGLVETARNDSSDTRFAHWKKSLEVPLPPMNRKKGRDVDFFFQALLTGFTLVAVPVLVGLGITVRYALPYIRTRL